MKGYRSKLMVKTTAFILCFLPTISCMANPTLPLTLKEAEQLAIQHEPELARLQANTHALKQQAIKDGQLADPKLILNVINVPTNSFSFTQDDMTMVGAGLQQSFPPGRSLALKSKRTSLMAKAEDIKVTLQTLVLLRDLRNTWLELCHAHHLQQLNHENRTQLEQLLKATESQYSSGKGNLAEVVQIQLELARLADQDIQIQQELTVQQAQLARWLGQEAVTRPLVETLPSITEPPALNDLQKLIAHHPILEVDVQEMKAARKGIELSKEYYKPGWTVDVSYGVRQGHMQNGMQRSNMATAMVTVDLPLFTHNRQDRDLMVSQDQLEAATFNRQVHYRDLLKELNGQYAMWQYLTKREALFHQQLIPKAKLNQKTAFIAFQNTTGDLASAFKATLTELNVRQELLHIKVERAKARVMLLYLEGKIE